MNTNIYHQKIEQEQAKGFLPRPLNADVRQSLMLLEEGLQSLEAACAAVDGAVLDAILARRYAYPDMFMEAVIANTIDSGNMARYPAQWIFHNERDRIRMNDYLVDEQSPFSPWADQPFTLTVRELPKYPLLGFRSPAAYVAFMLLLRDRRYDDALVCLNNSQRVTDERERSLFDGLFREEISIADVELIKFLLYRALYACYRDTARGTELRNTWGDVLISTVRLPAVLSAQAGKNWYGELLMKIRRTIKPDNA